MGSTTNKPSLSMLSPRDGIAEDSEEEILFKGRSRCAVIRLLDGESYSKISKGEGRNPQLAARDYLENIAAQLSDLDTRLEVESQSSSASPTYVNHSSVERSQLQAGQRVVGLGNCEDDDFLHDFLEFSTSSDESIEAVQEIMLSRLKGNGKQYLVKDVGNSIDNCRWLSWATLSENPRTEALVADYEKLLSTKVVSVDEHSDSAPNIRSEDKDVERALRNVPRRSDISSLGVHTGFSKFPSAHHVRPATVTTQDQGEHVSVRRPTYDTHVDDLFGQVDNSFDWLDFGLSDTELEQHLKKSWRNDRTKKKERKKQREELRLQGLIGKNPTGSNRKAKYLEGITMTQLRIEIDQFLLSPQQVLVLPPMNPAARKTVHEIGHRLGLTTKSQGRAKDRHPTMTKTLRTRKFDAATSTAALSSLFIRSGNAKMVPTRPCTKRRATPNTGIRYRDGEIVGASAPELDQDNRGRALLEKMGWSAGTGLGAKNNKGIAMPVSQVIKTTKAGLG